MEKNHQRQENIYQLYMEKAFVYAETVYGDTNEKKEICISDF